ncbi:calpain-like protease [Niveomyces insectorum RCEF 264]|uniref:Calpain-like protease n=1 Tax=Niveomyces insectorum RCEF 264 TaxID=1081102 RepID=A0A167RE54_9HYPO|nr:calpain-like protease [Niveomyces insectorum RCEF 264]
MEAKAKEREALIAQSSGKAALAHVIAAVEMYMKAVREASSPADRTRLRRKCDELMAYGERLKAGADAPVESAVASLSLSQAPSSEVLPKPAPPKAASSGNKALSTAAPPGAVAAAPSRELPKKEQIILLKASRLHGAVFPPWDAEPADDLFQLALSENTLYQDDTAFSMSSQQREVFQDWKRPAELFIDGQCAKTEAERSQLTERFMATNEDPDLVQDITTDCSVVASLCAMLKHANSRGGSPSLLATMVRPFDHDKGRPRCSDNGKYVFRLQFNGTFRKVVIDDRLPSSASRTLFVVDRRNPLLIWPALLEKAYLKVHGGYDFPGSNSGTDLWVLTGWIPEQIFIQSHELDSDHVWTRVKDAFDRGDVMVTLGTGRFSPEEEALLGLAGEHDYAVLDLQVDAKGARRMLVKNPWCDNLVWTGLGPSSASTASAVASGSPMTGTFWIGYEDVAQYFASLYLNWRPSLFAHRQDHHFTWTLPSKATAHSLVCNPQYAMQSPVDGTVWILLNRHSQDAELDIIRKRRRSTSAFSNQRNSTAGSAAPITSASPDSSSAPTTTSQVGFIALYVFTADGKRVQLFERPRWSHRSPLVDSPQTLLRFEARAGVAYTVVAAHINLPLPTYSFTLSFFSLTSLLVTPAVDMLPRQLEITDEWSFTTAGGSAASPDFVRNPQYALTLPAATPLTLLLCAEADDVPVRVDLVWARGQRVASLAMRDLVVSSGEYRRGCALAAVTPRTPPFSAATASTTSANTSGGGGSGSGSASFGSGVVDAGTYTVVVSTFERGQHTRYTLRVAAAVPPTLLPIPAEDAGKFRTSLAPLPLLYFDDDTVLNRASGSEDADHGELRRWAALDARLNTRISLVVQAVETRPGARTTTTGYTATAAAAAAASTTAVRVSVERVQPLGNSNNNKNTITNKNHGDRGEVLVATGDGQFQDMTVAGLRTGEVSLARASVYQHQGLRGGTSAASAAAAAPWFRIVVEVRNGRRLPNVGIQVDVLSSDRIQAHPWEEVR